MVNRLVDSASLYLRKHAENPIDWWPWCDEALRTARQTDRPIFLSVGYSSCHWCTVMEGEAFSNAAIAAYMNENFLPIKVDREERPDIDSIYMQALQMLTGQGGWPLNIFLTPEELVPFYGGTYFPVEPNYGRPGFLQVLQVLRRFYDQDKDKLGNVTSQVKEGLLQGAQIGGTDTLSEELLHQGLAACARILIPSGRGTCFPMIPYAGAALQASRLGVQINGTEGGVADICQQRGLDLALGGIYDHVGGGFHRYTVDPTWTVPHFEKMLYDNGQIVEYLADLWAIGQQEPAFERAIAKTVTWLQREMIAPEGYFYAAQDADSFAEGTAAEPEEGAFYVWSYRELQDSLTEEELKALTESFSVTPAGNFEGNIVLQRTQRGELSPLVERALSKLFNMRYGARAKEDSPFPPARNNQEARTKDWPGRIPAVTDTKMIVAWNSLMISGLARAAVAFHRPDWLSIALKAAQFIRHNQWVDSRLYRLNYEGKPQVTAQSEDYGLLIKAFLDIQQAVLVFPELAEEVGWLQVAVETQAEFDRWFWSEESGGYFNTPQDQGKDLLVRERSYQDNATPAANGVAIVNLVRLALLTENLTYLDRAQAALKAFGQVMEQIPRACPSLLASLDWFRHGTMVRTTPEHVGELASIGWPTTALTFSEDLPENTIGMVCQGMTCLKPATSFEIIQQQILQRSKVAR
jgi:uncharacterized protein YyaL (SSP411 family)